MGKAIIIGEDHTLPGRELIEANVIRNVHSEGKLRAIYIEGWDQAIKENTDRVHLENLSKRLKVPIVPITYPDNANVEAFGNLLHNEKELSIDLMKAFRAERQKVNQSLEEVVANKLNNAEEGTNIFIGGFSHVRGILKNLDPSLKSKVVPLLKKQSPIYIQGDIFLSPEEVIAHGVAQQDIEDMGTGIAKDLRAIWPQSYECFKKFRRNHSFNTGEIFLDDSNNPMIAYLATQPDLYHAEIPYIRKSLRNLKKSMEKNYIFSCALPKIGCGYGKLQYEEIKPIIDEVFANSKQHIVVYE